MYLPLTLFFYSNFMVVTMAWFSRFTRFGDVHAVYGQELNNSCIIASAIMCVFKINKLRPNAASVHTTSDIIAKYKAAEGNPTHNFDTTGGDPKLIARVLNTCHCGTWKGDWVSAQDVSKIIHDKVGVTKGFGPSVDVNPVIAGVGWSAGGGHAVVVDTVRSWDDQLYATVCDPWDADVHITAMNPSTPFVYEPKKSMFSHNFWGASKGDKQPFNPKTTGSGVAIVYRT